MNVIRCRIKEHSTIARIAAWRMKSHQVAIVFGNVIHLHGTSREEFLRSVRWVRHEVCHVKQYRETGYWRFLRLYIIEWIRYGYYNISFEREARKAELDPTMLDGVEIM